MKPIHVKRTLSAVDLGGLVESLIGTTNIPYEIGGESSSIPVNVTVSMTPELKQRLTYIVLGGTSILAVGIVTAALLKR